MRILALSDLHFGKTKGGWSPTYAEDRVEAAIKAAKKFQPDVFYFGGDLADHGPEDDKLVHFRRGLEALDQIPVDKRVFVCGNHDLEFMEGDSLYDYPDLLQEQLNPFGFHLVDREPYTDGQYALVGNIALHDGSLWNQPDNVDPDWPSTLEEVQEKDGLYWKKTLAGFGDIDEVTSGDFHQWCMKRLADDWASASFHHPKVVVCTHYVPGPKFVIGGSAKYEYLNWYMGFDGAGQVHPKYGTRVYRHEHTVLGLCGHTHRDHLARIGTTWVRNVSGPGQPWIIDLE